MLEQPSQHRRCLIPVILDQNGNKTANFPGDTLWIERLLPYLEGQNSMFVCPSDSHPNTPGQSAVQLNVSVLVQGSGAGTYQMSDSSIYWQMINGSYGSGTFSMGLDFDYPIHTSFDNDITVQVTIGGDGTITLNVTGEEDYGQMYQFLDANGNVLGSANQGSTVTIQSNAGAANTSYAVNNAAKWFAITEDSGKVLAVEYVYLVANLVTTKPPRLPWTTGPPLPRHVMAGRSMCCSGMARCKTCCRSLTLIPACRRFMSNFGCHRFFRRHLRFNLR